MSRNLYFLLHIKFKKKKKAGIEQQGKINESLLCIFQSNSGQENLSLI